MPQEPVIKLDRISKAFRDQKALSDFQLEVPPGVVFALLGENGAGKTTAIRTMLGLVQPDSGESTVLGMPSLSKRYEIRHQIGYVPERPTLYEWMTVSEIGWFAAGFYPEGFFDRFRELATNFELPLQRKIKQLSKGMRSKVALSLALSHRPRLLILDEPTSGLDTLVRRQFLESMVDFATDGRTVFLSSHQINEVERVADIVAIVHEGRVLTCEALDDLKSDTVELIVTLSDNTTPFEFPGQSISAHRNGRTCQVYARGGAEIAMQGLQPHALVTDIEVRRPSLEDIFVAYMCREKVISDDDASRDNRHSKVNVTSEENIR